MRDLNKGKFHLVDEVGELRKQVADLKQAAIERRRIEDGLRRDSELLRALLDGAPIPLCLLTAQHRPLLANQALARLLGYSAPGELVRVTADLGLLLGEAAAGAGHAASELRLRRKDGSALTARIRWSDPTDAGQLVLAVVG